MVVALGNLVDVLLEGAGDLFFIGRSTTRQWSKLVPGRSAVVVCRF